MISGQLMAAPSYEPYSYVFKNKNDQYRLNNSLFSTTGFYDYSGNEQPLPLESSFSRIQSEAIYRRGFTSRFEAGIFGRYRTQTSEQKDSTGVLKSNNNAGLDSYGVLFKYQLPKANQLRYAIESGARLVSYKNSAYETSDPYKEIVLGDDVNEVFLGGSFSYETKSQNFISGRIHYNYPTTKLSSEFKYDLQGALVWEHWAWLAGVEGIYSLNQDQYADNTAGKPMAYTQTTHLYNTINRSYVAPYIGINIAFNDHWRVETKASSIVQAISYDKGNEYFVNLVYSSGKEENNRMKKTDERFKTYNVEASVVKVSPRAKFIRIDKGLAQDVEKGMRADIFEFDYLGGNKLLASGVVFEVGADAAVVKIIEMFGNDVEIKLGHVVRLSPLD